MQCFRAAFLTWKGGWRYHRFLGHAGENRKQDTVSAKHYVALSFSEFPQGFPYLRVELKHCSRVLAKYMCPRDGPGPPRDGPGPPWYPQHGDAESYKGRQRVGQCSIGDCF